VDQHLDRLVIEDFLAAEQFTALQEVLSSPDFPWYFQDNVTDANVEASLKDFGFTHKLFIDGAVTSDWFDLVEPLARKVESSHPIIGTCTRARADMTTCSEAPYMHGWHVDSLDEHISAVFYVNASDGATMFADGFSCLPTPNKLLIFDGANPHTGHSPTNTQRRIIVNFNFEKL